MKCLIELHPSAKEELKKAFQWYEKRSPGLGERFIKAVNERLTEIAGYPDRYAKRKAEFREVVTKIFRISLSMSFWKKIELFLLLIYFTVKEIPN